MPISTRIRETAPVLLQKIKEADSVLLHFHPSPDPDSVGSALAMKLVLEQMGKKATVIKGDSEFPTGFKHFPGAGDIVSKNFTEIEISKFDLFIVLDSADLHRVTMRGEVSFPDSLTVINIDHHGTNPEFGHQNLIVPEYPATAQILYDVFQEWNIKLTPEIAANLFIGIYSDTGGLKYRGTTVRTYEIMTELVKLVPSFTELIFEMENSNLPGFIAFQGLAFSSVETFLNGNLAVSSVRNSAIKEKNVDLTEAHSSEISPLLRSVIGWNIAVSLVEVEPDIVKASFRTRDHVKYDVAKLAAVLGGGGHVTASGATLKMPFEEAKRKIVETAASLYNLRTD